MKSQGRGANYGRPKAKYVPKAGQGSESKVAAKAESLVARMEKAAEAFKSKYTDMPPKKAVAFFEDHPGLEDEYDVGRTTPASWGSRPRSYKRAVYQTLVKKDPNWTPDNLRAIYSRYIEERHGLRPLTRDQFYRALQLDGVETALTAIGDKALQYGVEKAAELAPKAIDFLLSKASSFFGGLFDQSVDAPTAPSLVKETTPSGAVSNLLIRNNMTSPPEIPPSRRSDLFLDAVNVDAIATWLTPWSKRTTAVPDSFDTAPNCVIRTTYEFDITTDANGNAMAYILPQAYIAQGNAASFFISLPVTGIAPITGFYTTTQYYANPLFGAAPFPIQDGYLIGCSVTYLPTNSVLNARGKVECVQLKSTANNTFSIGPNPNLPQADMQKQADYGLYGANDHVHLTWYPSGLEDYTYQNNISPRAVGALPFDDLFYFLFTGQPPTVNIGTIRINLAYQYHPNATSAQLNPPNMPRRGNATHLFMCNLLSAYSLLSQTCEGDMESLANLVREAPSQRHDTLISYVMDNYRRTDA